MAQRSDLQARVQTLLLEAITAENLTRKQVAARLGVVISAVIDRLNGTKPLTITKAEEIANALGYEIGVWVRKR